MRRIELEVGDPVEAQKTVIARIEPNDPEFLDPRSVAVARAGRDAAAAARDYARAQLQRAVAERDFAALEYRRIEALAERKTVSQNERDAAERRAKTAAAFVDEAKATLEMRESEYAQAKARLLTPTRAVTRRGECECVLVHSPVSGTVLRLVTESEGIVQPGAALVEVGDPARLEVVVDLLSAEAVRVRAGQRVLIEAWGASNRSRASCAGWNPSGS